MEQILIYTKVCLTCGSDFNSDEYVECDNACGTIICDRCNTEYYVINDKLKQGHHPLCGLSD